MKEGKTLSTPLFLFYFKRGDSPHYAFVAPKGLFKNATKRNKYRRMGYNIIRSIPLKSCFGVFIYKKQAIFATQKEIKEAVTSLLNKTNV
jgi:ribonuclease P protein component